MISLHPMPWPEVRARWAWVRSGLQACAAKAGERWWPEDLYGYLQNGSAYCYAVKGAARDVGFAIVQRHNDPDGPALFVWALWCEPNAIGRNHNELHGEFERLAWHIGARRIRMESPRRGWEQMKFWTPKRVIYEHEVDYERWREQWQHEVRAA